MKTPLLFAALCAATFALAQAEPGAFAPIDETSAEVDMEEDATSKVQEFLDAKGWTEGDNAKSDGSTFIVSVGYGTIAAPPSSPSYNASRPRAFAKAMLDAKSQMARYLEQTLSVAVEMSYAEQGASGDPTPQEEMAAALNAMPDDSLIGKGKRYLHAKMDNLLSKEGVDTSAALYAVKHGLKLTEFRPDYRRYGKGAPLKRNITIIENADLVLSFWDGSSRGTKYVIDQCRKRNIPIKEVPPI